MKDHALAIAITNRCPLRCAFCCVPPGPGDLPEHKINQIVEDVIRGGLIKSVGFTGGEPLIKISEVCKNGEILSKNGIRWGVTTGMGWTKNPWKAESAAKYLVNSGISQITVSYDPSHFSDARHESTSAFLQEVVQAGIETRISVTHFSDEVGTIDIDLIKKFPFIDNKNNVKMEYFYVAPVGFAKDKKNCSNSRMNFLDSKCPLKTGLTLSVWPDGSVYPCCSTYVVNKNKELVIGNVFDESINSILQRAESNIYMMAIRKLGFSSIIALTPNSLIWKEVFMETPQDVCHLCSKISSIKGSINALEKELVKIHTDRE